MSVEIEAYKIAQGIISDAKKTSSNFINLSPYISYSAKRMGFQALASLSSLPKEIESLSRLEFLEIRGTKITDLSSLIKLPNLRIVEFEGIDACYDNEDLRQISEIKDPKERTIQLFSWIARNYTIEPPEQKAEGPQFLIPDVPPVVLLDENMSQGDDNDQKYLQEELQIKAFDLVQIASLSDNIAPRLSGAVMRYHHLIALDSDDIGARSIWSHANTLDSIWQVHQQALVEDRNSDILPISVAACLDDLLATHRVWFLGHPGARAVMERSSRHVKKEDAERRLKVSADILAAADYSGIFDSSALSPALTNVQTAREATGSGVAALGELEDWTWNLIAAASRKIWTISQNPPGGAIGGNVAGAYISLFIMQNESSLGLFAKEFMSHGPIWWETVLNLCRRYNARNIDEE